MVHCCHPDPHLASWVGLWPGQLSFLPGGGTRLPQLPDVRRRPQGNFPSIEVGEGSNTLSLGLRGSEIKEIKVCVCGGVILSCSQSGRKW